MIECVGFVGAVNWGRLIEGTGKIERDMSWENDKEEEGGGEERKRKKKNEKKKGKVFSVCVKVGGHR